MINQTELLYTIALGNIPEIGCMTVRKLISAMGSAQNVLLADKKHLIMHEHLQPAMADNIINKKESALQQAEEEILWIQKNNISILHIEDDNYPSRLKQCVDAPPLLFARGSFNANATHCISIVGTRHCTSYGVGMTKEIVKELAPYHPLIISGLALGIDTAAHQAAVDNGLCTIGILGHGLKFLYPSSNVNLAKQMVENGGVITEFTSSTSGEAFNFPRRNRIIAGMSDAVIVIEAKARGGALITANLGFSYDRDVFALPGKATDITSAGCNNLIKQNKAALITGGHDIAVMMNWTSKRRSRKKQADTQLLISFDENEKKIIQALQEKEGINIDDLAIATQLDNLTLSNTLLTLELKGSIECVPGKKYYLHLT